MRLITLQTPSFKQVRHGHYEEEVIFTTAPQRYRRKDHDKPGNHLLLPEIHALPSLAPWTPMTARGSVFDPEVQIHSFQDHYKTTKNHIQNFHC